MMGLTPVQKKLLDFIRSYIAEHGCSPTYEEMRPVVGCASRSGVGRVVDALESRGHIRRMPYCARSIEIVGAAALISDADLAQLSREELFALHQRVSTLAIKAFGRAA